MKLITLISIAFLICILSVSAQDKKAMSLTINISGMKSDKGKLFVALFNKENDFLQKRYREDIVPISNKKAVTTFKDLPKGTYAVSVYHDENNNKTMDTNFLGIPKESYGNSNGARGSMGPPKYEEAKFPLTQSNTISITVE